MTDFALSASSLCKQFRPATWFARSRSPVQAVDQVSFELKRGRTLGIVGESGCGKSTLAKLITGLIAPDSGTLSIRGQAASSLPFRERCRRVQLVFQDPKRALNPSRSVRDLLDTPLRRLCGLSARERLARSQQVLADVGLDASYLDRVAHELSGGQAQRVGIARALAVNPDVVVLDEALSSLDVSLQADVLRLLHRHQRRSGIAYVFISHDLAVVEALADSIAVMYLGRIVESGPGRALLADPRHPYTRVLLSAVPVPGSRQNRIPQRGDPGDASDLPSGCHYHPRCYRAEPRCRDIAPPLAPVETERPATEAEHRAACLFANDSS
jgi:peptide/nickel transport system ATP-binding protein